MTFSHLPECPLKVCLNTTAIIIYKSAGVPVKTSCIYLTPSTILQKKEYLTTDCNNIIHYDLKAIL